MPPSLSLSGTQRGLWMLQRLYPEAPMANIGFVVELPRPTTVSQLRRALENVGGAHPHLRSRFVVAGGVLERHVHATSDGWYRLRAAPTPFDPDGISHWVEEPFELEGGPLLRAVCWPDRALFVVHHIVFDALSRVPFAADLLAALDGEPVPPRPAPEIDDERRRADVEFWTSRLRGIANASMDLPTDRPRPGEPSFAAAKAERRLPEETLRAVEGLRQRLGTTTSTVHLAAYAALLHRHGAGSDIVVGVPVTLRTTETAQAVCCAVSMLPLRVSVRGDTTVDALVHACGNAFLTLLLHRSASTEDLLGPLRLDRTDETRPFRHAYTFESHAALGATTAGGRVEGRISDAPANLYSRFDLDLRVTEHEDGTAVALVYRSELFDRWRAERLLERYEQFLGAAAHEATVGDLPMWTPHDRRAIGDANATGDPTGAFASETGGTVLHTVLAQAGATPDAVAGVHGEQSRTYADLRAEARAVAAGLAARGVTHDDIVAIAVGRSLSFLPAALGSWWAGAAFLPLDLEHPPERLAFQLADAGVRAVIADATGAALLAEHQLAPVDHVLRADRPGDARDGRVLSPPDDGGLLAYVLYTSGSTGRPKGVEVQHRALRNLLSHFRHELAITSADRVLALTTFSFDIAMLELFLPLCAGARVVMAGDAERAHPERLTALVASARPTVVQATPTAWCLLCPHLRDHLAGVRLLCGGEAMPRDLASDLLATGARVWNVYGPTETTIWSTAARITATPPPGEPVSIGRPIAATTVVVADADGRALPAGVPGELLIGGLGLARGYRNRGELTAERFVERPAGRYYRTGDLATWTSAGTLRFHGRMDRQVKLRGNRIELGEVEALAEAGPGVGGAIATVEGEGPAAQLVLWVEPAGAAPLDEQRVWHHLRKRMPGAVLPQRIVIADRLPRTANGKLDRSGVGAAPQPSSDGGDAPRDDVERRMHRLWTEAIGDREYAPHDSFFLVGGDSVQAITLLGLMQREFGVDVSLRGLMRSPTLREMGNLVRTTT